VLLLYFGIGLTLLAAGMIVNWRQLGTRLTEFGYPIKELRVASIRALRIFSGAALLLVGVSVIGFGIERL
jgi:hypothetical protein